MQEMPRGMERRLVLRLLTYWRDIRGERSFPALSDVQREQIADMWPNVFVLDVATNPADPCFVEFGDKLSSAGDAPLRGCPVSLAPPNTLLNHSVSYCQEVIRKQVPISRGGEFINNRGIKVLYRSIILPMSSNSATIDRLLGAANCREVVDG